MGPKVLLMAIIVVMAVYPGLAVALVMAGLTNWLAWGTALLLAVGVIAFFWARHVRMHVVPAQEVIQVPPEAKTLRGGPPVFEGMCNEIGRAHV